MLYGYIDESGTPGIVASDADFLVVSLVVVKEPCKGELIASLEDVLEKMEIDEIHFAHNTDKIKKKIITLIAKMDFEFISVSIRKNELRSHASYANIAKLLSEEIMKKYSEVRIEMDTNPKLLEALRKSFKGSGCRIKIKQMRSKNNYGIQLADYVVGLSAQKVKGKDSGNYFKIVGKCISFVER